MANPLTAEDRKQIEKALGLIGEVEKEIVRARLAGLDVTEQESRLKDLKARLTAIKQAYFPAAR